MLRYILVLIFIITTEKLFCKNINKKFEIKNLFKWPHTAEIKSTEYYPNEGLDIFTQNIHVNIYAIVDNLEYFDEAFRIIQNAANLLESNRELRSEGYQVKLNLVSVEFEKVSIHHYTFTNTCRLFVNKLENKYTEANVLVYFSSEKIQPVDKGILGLSNMLDCMAVILYKDPCGVVFVHELLHTIWKLDHTTTTTDPSICEIPYELNLMRSYYSNYLCSSNTSDLLVSGIKCKRRRSFKDTRFDPKYARLSQSFFHKQLNTSTIKQINKFNNRQYVCRASKNCFSKWRTYQTPSYGYGYFYGFNVTERQCLSSTFCPSGSLIRHVELIPLNSQDRFFEHDASNFCHGGIISRLSPCISLCFVNRAKNIIRHEITPDGRTCYQSPSSSSLYTSYGVCYKGTCQILTPPPSIMPLSRSSKQHSFIVSVKNHSLIPLDFLNHHFLLPPDYESIRFLHNNDNMIIRKHKIGAKLYECHGAVFCNYFFNFLNQTHQDYKIMTTSSYQMINNNFNIFNFYLYNHINPIMTLYNRYYDGPTSSSLL